MAQRAEENADVESPDSWADDRPTWPDMRIEWADRPTLDDLSIFDRPTWPSIGT